MNAKKKKKIWIIAGSVVGVIVIALVIVVLSLGSIVKTAVQTIGPKALGAEVKVSGVFINLFTGTIAISDVFIGNPEGYKSDRALTMKKLKLHLEPSSLTKPKLVIREFTLDGVDVYFEPSSNLLSNNLSQLNKNIAAFTEKLAGSKDAPADGQFEDSRSDAEIEAEKSEAQRLQIDQLSLTNIYVNIVATIPGRAPDAAPIPVVPIVLENLGQDEEGVTPLDVSVVILNKLTLGVLQSVGEALPSLKNITDAGQNLLNETGKAGEKILEDTKGVVKNLKNLLPFGGKKNEAGK